MTTNYPTKTIVFIRHAKSSWSDISIDDFERPLNERGMHNAPQIGKYLHNQQAIKPDLLLSSPATRALTTARLIAQELDYPSEQIITDQRLYVFTSDVTEPLNIIAKIDDQYKTLCVFGHNPTFTYLCNYFGTHHFDEIPTCGAVCFKIASQYWAEIATAPAAMQFYVFPKMLS